MNQDSHVTQRLTEAQVPRAIHRANANMVWHLEWHGESDGGAKVFRVAQFVLPRHAHEYVYELAERYNQLSYTLTRI